VKIDWNTPLVCDLGDGSEPLRVKTAGICMHRDDPARITLENIDRTVAWWAKGYTHEFLEDGRYGEHDYYGGRGPFLWQIRNVEQPSRTFTANGKPISDDLRLLFGGSVTGVLVDPFTGDIHVNHGSGEVVRYVKGSVK